MSEFYGVRECGVRGCGRCSVVCAARDYGYEGPKLRLVSARAPLAARPRTRSSDQSNISEPS